MVLGLLENIDKWIKNTVQTHIKCKKAARWVIAGNISPDSLNLLAKVINAFAIKKLIYTAKRLTDLTCSEVLKNHNLINARGSQVVRHGSAKAVSSVRLRPSRPLQKNDIFIKYI